MGLRRKKKYQKSSVGEITNWKTVEARGEIKRFLEIYLSFFVGGILCLIGAGFEMAWRVDRVRIEKFIMQV